MFTSIDDIPVTEHNLEIPAVPIVATAITSADEEGILAKMMRAPNAPEPAATAETVQAVTRTDRFEAAQVPARKTYAWQRNAASKVKK